MAEAFLSPNVAICVLLPAIASIQLFVHSDTHLCIYSDLWNWCMFAGILLEHFQQSDVVCGSLIYIHGF